MKLELQEFGIYLIPEDYADKMYIARFVKHAHESKEIGNVECLYKRSVYKNDVLVTEGGYLDPTLIYEDNEHRNSSEKVDVEDITGLSIFSDNI